MLVVKQESTTGTTFGYAHIHSVNLLLIERITAGGMNLFTLADTVQATVKLI